MTDAVLVIVGTLTLAGMAIVVGRYFSLWLQAKVTGTHIGLLSLVMMSLRKVDPRLIVQCKVMAVQAGLANFPTNAIEAQYLAGGNVHRITLALIVAHRAGIDLDWNTAAAVDLAGRDILKAVQVSVNPRVINCPDPESANGGTLDGVAKDGIQLKVRVRVTVRTNLSNLIGGATEATIVARVGQGIVSAIGACDSYREALADPQIITRQVLERGLDSQTAFAIVSIDIADIDVGVNIGARLKVDQADADIRMARARAEQRRAMAIAHEQEMVALTIENLSTVILAEAEVPTAMATALRAGQLRVNQPTVVTSRPTEDDQERQRQRFRGSTRVDEVHLPRHRWQEKKSTTVTTTELLPSPLSGFFGTNLASRDTVLSVKPVGHDACVDDNQ